MVKMRYTTLLDKASLIENLVEYLPAKQRAFKATQAYLNLCDAVWSVIKARPDDREEMQQVLKHERSVFNDFCDFEIELESQRIDEERQRSEERNSRIEAMRSKTHG